MIWKLVTRKVATVGTVVVIDYGMGNLHSVAKALETVGADVCVTSKAQDLCEACGIVLPGVGSFANGIQALHRLNLVSALDENVRVRRKPFLGICLGMQLTARVGAEHGPHQGLGWFDAEVAALPEDQGFKVPHMGWDDVVLTKETPLFNGKKLNSKTTFYFVHSYHFVPQDASIVTSWCSLGDGTVRVAASVNSRNIHLTQFHPEKSQKAGLEVLQNFVQLTAQDINAEQCVINKP